MHRLSLTLMAALATAVLPVHARPQQSVPPRLDRMATTMVDAGVAPALVAVVVDHGHVSIHGYGKLPDGRAPDADTVFELGSLSKTFTALLLARELEQGKASLDTPVGQWLPGWSIPSLHGKAITLGLLAEQYSGLPRVPGNLAPPAPTDPYADYGADKLKRFLAGYTLPREPGAHYEYSNLGFGLLGYALARHAGLGYGALLQRDVLQPLGMPHTGVTAPTKGARLAPGHGPDGAPAPAWHWRDALAGAGAMLSDGHDMAIYLQASMGTKSTPLAAAIRLAQQPRRDAGPLGRIGLAWMTTRSADGDVVWHNGATGGYSSFIGFNASPQYGVVLLANGYASNLLTGVGLASLSSALPMPPLQVLPEATLEQYVGRYVLAPGMVFTVSRRGRQLYAQLTGQPALPVFASASDRFSYTAVQAALDFQRDARGRVVALVLHQNGQSRRAPRTP